MKKNFKKLFLFLVVFVLISVAGYSQSHMIASTDEIITFYDPNVAIWNEANMDGSLILSWDENSNGLAAGFADLTVYTPFPDGGKYEIALIAVVNSTADKIEGIWEIRKNEKMLLVAMGTATNLAAPIGGVIEIVIDGFKITIRISFKFDGLRAPNELVGQTSVDGVPLVGAMVKVRGSGMVLDQQYADGAGKYRFFIDPANVNRIVTNFSNFDPDIVISGKVFSEGKPLVGATVLIANQVGELDSIVTDANGYYQSKHLLNASGPGANNIRVIVIMPK